MVWFLTLVFQSAAERALSFSSHHWMSFLLRCISSNEAAINALVAANHPENKQELESEHRLWQKLPVNMFLSQRWYSKTHERLSQVS